MPRRLLPAFLLALAFAGGNAWANACSCTAGTTCTDTSSTNWTSCGGTFPGVGDSVTVPATATVNFAGASWTFQTLYVVAGGAGVTGGIFNCSGAGAQTLTLSATQTKLGLPTSIFLEGGATATSGAATFTCGTGSNGAKTIIFSGTGAATTTQSLVWLAGGTSTNLPATDANLTFRGAEHLYGTATTVPAELVSYRTCMDVTAIGGSVANVAVGDTLAFTSGKSDGFVYRVACKPDTCTGPGAPDACCKAADQSQNTGTTTTCDTTTCNGGPCDLELERNSTLAPFNSHLMATSVGGPAREGTPLDSDANGTADPTGTLPAAGDSLIAYAPSVFKGSASGFTTGASAIWDGVSHNVRFTEFANLAGDSDACTSDSGLSSIHYGIMKPTNNNIGCFAAGVPLACCSGSQAGTCTAGTFGLDFQNVYDWVSRNSHEIQRTDSTANPADTRSDYGFVGKYWYVHDPGGSILTCNAGGVSAQKFLGAGLTFTTDSGPDYKEKNVVLQKVHLARLNSAPVNVFGAQNSADTTPWSGFRLDDWNVHDIPKQTTYPDSSGSGPAMLMKDGTDFEANRWMVYDIGNANVAMRALDGWSLASNVSPTTFNNARFDSWWVVNVDTNQNADAPGNETIVNLGQSGCAGGSCVSGACSGGSMAGAACGAAADTSRLIVTNGYFANFVGGLSTGGTWRYNFVRNPNIDDGVNGCDTVETATMWFPVEATGNVIYATNANSCSQTEILNDHDDPVPAGSCSFNASGAQYRIMSNLLTAPTCQTSIASGAVIGKSNGGAFNNTCGIDVYNNLIDQKTCDSAAEYSIRSTYNTTPDSTANINAYYNIIRNPTGNGFGLVLSADGGFFHDYNRFFQTAAATPVSGGTPNGLNTSEVDSDLADMFVGSATNDYRIRCDSWIRTANRWGGPVGPLAYGLKSLDDFHPAAQALMNADAFKMRFDWRGCTNAFEDTVPR